jgi:steroid delta-isomerase-like uncharacterized protein
MEFLKERIKGFADFNMAVEDMIAEEDKVWTRFKVTGTHTGEYSGFAPTGKKIEFASVQMFRIVNGKIAECYAVSDSAEFLRQLGAMEYTEEAKKALDTKHSLQRISSKEFSH